MKKELKLELVLVTLLAENTGTRVIADDENVILINQGIDDISKIIEYNFNIVNSFYKNKAKNIVDIQFDLAEINHISIAIVLHFLYMYNTWKNTYKNKADQSLLFVENDFKNPATFDIIAGVYKKKHPDKWHQMSSKLLGISEYEFNNYYNERSKFYNQ